ncbi:MAG: MEKHLA domain-containing protein [Nitrospirae bacterium]|nr:MEKHLA domain-containing protein [Nitrospirota bacterium]
MVDHIWAHPSVITWSQRLLDSFYYWTGRELLARDGSDSEQARQLFVANFVVVSHGLEADPILNYGNQAALDLWETTWEQLIHTPSRQTAEPVDREERTLMLALAEQQGYFTGYRGVRVSATGQRFLVEGATVWNVLDHRGDLANRYFNDGSCLHRAEVSIAHSGDIPSYIRTAATLIGLVGQQFPAQAAPEEVIEVGIGSDRVEAAFLMPVHRFDLGERSDLMVDRGT